MTSQVPEAPAAGTDLRALAALALALLLWAASFPITRIALVAYAPEHLALARYILATLVLLAYCVLVRAPLPRRADLPALALTGLLWGALSFLGGALALIGVGAGAVEGALATLRIAVAQFDQV